jgi:putative ABC transport system permease protein
LVLEGFYLAVLGAILGVILVTVAQFLVRDGLPMPPTPGTNRELPVKLDLRLSYYLSAMGLAGFAAIGATLLSALQVLRLSIVQALRSAS